MKNQIKLIAITGGSGAGKTWLTGYLQNTLGAENVSRLALDDFYRDLSQLPPALREQFNFDHPDTIDWLLFSQVLDDCRRGRPTRIPRYNFTTHTRVPFWDNFFPAPLVLVEGLWLLWQPRILEWFDLKIYIDCAAQLRLERRLMRDVAERGRSADSVRTQFWKTVAPMHDQFVAPQAKWADLVLRAPTDNRELEELVETIEMELLSNFTPSTNWLEHEELQPA